MSTSATRKVIRARRQALATDEIIISAMERELKRLQKLAQKAKNEEEDCANAFAIIMQCHKDAAELIDNGQYKTKAGIEKLEKLAATEKVAIKNSEKDWIKLSDKAFELQIQTERLAEEIARKKFIIALRNKPQ